MRLTKKKALEETVRIWKELARTGAEDKASVKGTDKYNNGCPCCEYDTQSNSGQICAKCPITNWSGYVGKDGAPCTNIDSPYAKWCTHIRDDRRRFARQIVRLAQKHLKTLTKKK